MKLRSTVEVINKLQSIDRELSEGLGWNAGQWVLLQQRDTLLRELSYISVGGNYGICQPM